MERWNGRVALVTGASVGIGAAICRELVNYGLTVVGCARNLSKIQALAEEEDVAKAPGKLHAIKCDLTKESEILAMFDEIRTKFNRIDICVNNAGFSSNSPLLTGATEDWRSMFEVNVLALCICTRESVKLMKEKEVDEGQIIHISSIAGHKLPDTIEGAGFNFYCGTKFMVRALTEGLRQEVKAASTNIRVSSISPGTVETEFFNKSLDPTIVNYMFKSMNCLQPKDVADAVVYILKSPSHVDVNDIIMQAVEKKAS